MRKIKVGVVSLGCNKNQVDSEVMLGLLRDGGFTITANAQEAEILVINTCGFITAAKEESINTILETARLKEDGNLRTLVVAGCLAQKYKDELLSEIPEIDAVVGTGDFPAIVEVINQSLSGTRVDRVGAARYLYDHEAPRILTTSGLTAYIKIAEGCTNCCSYCVIPELRGPYRSRREESILQEAATLAAGGAQELILIAQDTTRYGLDLYGEFRLAGLLRKLVRIEGLQWIRLLYCYPAYFTPELITTVAEEPKICKYFDIPLQHANDRILKAMNRQGNQAEVVRLLEQIRAAIPNVTLRTTFIVGFPGETDSEFATLLDFIRQQSFDRVGAFVYSQEEGTLAADMPGQIPEQVKQDRYDQLMQVQLEISRAKNEMLINHEISVLLEGKTSEDPELYVGRSERDAPEIDGVVYVQCRREPQQSLVQVRITGAGDYDLMGEMRP